MCNFLVHSCLVRCFVVPKRRSNIQYVTTLISCGTLRNTHQSSSELSFVARSCAPLLVRPPCLVTPTGGFRGCPVKSSSSSSVSSRSMSYSSESLSRIMSMSCLLFLHRTPSYGISVHKPGSDFLTEAHHTVLLNLIKSILISSSRCVLFPEWVSL
jgi:hypothetical protein